MKIKVLGILIAASLALSMLLASCETKQNSSLSEGETTASVSENKSTVKIGEIETAENGLSYRLYTEESGEKYYALVGMGNKYKDSALVIPESFKDLPVKLIADSAFQSSKQITSVTIPNSVTAIGKLAFGDCDKLTELVIPDSVTSIGERAFSDCDTLATVTVGNGVKAIAGKMFYSCDKLATVSLGTAVKSIGFEAFFGCSELKELVLPEGLSVIEDHAFWACYQLEKLEIADQLTSIGKDVFYACSALKTTEVDGAHYLGSTNNPHLLLVGISDKTITEFTVHGNTKYIGESVFSDCSALTTVTLPAGITLLAEGAFSHCSVLTSINFQGSTADWNSISKGYLWDHESGNYVVTCSDGSVSKAQ